jgi:hypothetical protein
MPSPNRSFPPGVIDVGTYCEELSLVRSWLESRADDSLEDNRAAKTNFVFCRRRDIERIVPRRSKDAARIAVAAGQYLLWYHARQPMPRHHDDFLETQPFHDLFDLHWFLLKRRLTLDVATATDLIRIDVAGRGDTEPRHALVALLERNFSPAAPARLQSILCAWADGLAIDRSANFRKLADRVWKLAGIAT